MKQILTPESERAENPPDKLYVHTEKYGETVTTLKPGFDSEVKKYHDKYEIEIPKQMLDFCREVKTLGGRALLEGGCVRDTVISAEIPNMNLKPKDYDFEVFGLSKEQLHLLLETNFNERKIDEVGKAFGVIKVYLEGYPEPFDFSIPRRDSKEGSGHRGIKADCDPTMSIKEAGFRRDLKMNVMAYDPLTKVLYDPYGGVEDIKNHRIAVTDIETFQEDPLRVMRVMQFAARFDFTITDETKAVCKKMVERGDLDELARERMKEELLKLLSKGIKPSIGFEFAREVGIVKRYWPELNALIGIQQEPDWHPEGDVWTHTMQVVDASVAVANRELAAGKLNESDKLVLVLAALCHDFGKPETTKFEDGAFRARGHEPAGVAPAEIFIERYFANPNAKGISELTKQVLPLVAEHLKPKYYWENEAIKGMDQTNALRRLARKLSDGDKNLYPNGGGSNIYMLSLVAEADQRGRNGKENKFLGREEVIDLDNWQSWILAKTEKLRIKESPLDRLLTGERLLEELGLKKGGVWVGTVLDCVYNDQMDGKITNVTEAVANAKAYKDVLTQKVQYTSRFWGVNEDQLWINIRSMEDPRKFLEY